MVFPSFLVAHTLRSLSFFPPYGFRVQRCLPSLLEESRAESPFSVRRFRFSGDSDGDPLVPPARQVCTPGNTSADILFLFSVAATFFLSVILEGNSRYDGQASLPSFRCKKYRFFFSRGISLSLFRINGTSNSKGELNHPMANLS